MNYDMTEQNRQNGEEMNNPNIEYDRRRTRMNMNTGENMNKMKMGGMRVNDTDRTQMLEQIYNEIDERMCMALAFHEQLADYFCFLGLQGFKRMAEYQYMKECAEKRKLHKRYIDMHNKVLPVSNCQKPVLIPREWSKHTTHDIDDSVIPKYTRTALKQYYEWEKETKELYQELCDKLMSLNMVADYEFLKELVLDVEKECKKVMRMYESLNGTGYDVNAIHSMQDKYHEKYKKKYNDRFTTKNNYRQVPEYPDRRTTRRIGFEY